MSIEQLSKRTQTADGRVASIISETIDRLHMDDIDVVDISLGGTLSMVRGPKGKLIFQGIGRFGKPELVAFNERKFYYRPEKSLEPETHSPWGYDMDLRLATGVRFMPFADTEVGTREYTIREIALKVSHGWPDMTKQGAVPEGLYPFKTLATNYHSAPTYSAALTKQIASGKYPNGIGFDSNEIYDRGPVFAAVVCSYIIPKVFEGIRKVAKDKAISFEEALRETIFVIPMGTDKEADVETFLDLFAYFTGSTFITVGANSPFGTPKGDAETNLKDITKVAKLIKRGILPRGVAYSIADRLVMQSIFMKMDPSARGLEQTVKAHDGMIFNGTFLSAHANYIDEVEENGWPVKQIHPRAPHFLSILGSAPPLNEKDQNIWIAGVSWNAANLTRAFLSSHRTNILYMPPILPPGTRTLIIEGGGEANGPAHAAEMVRQVVGQQWARTDRKLTPTIVIASETGIPFVSDEEVYDASLKGIESIMKAFHLNSSIVNAKSLPGHAVEFLADLLIYPRIVEDIFDPPVDKQFYHIEPDELQSAIDDYGKSRKLKGF